MRIFFLFLSLLLLSSNFLEAQQSSIDTDKLRLLKEKSREASTDALIIYENNELFFEEYAGSGHRDSLIQPWSCTKSIVGLAVMALLDDGLLDSLNQPVSSLYSEWNQGQKKDITVEHLLNMSSGLQCAPRMHAEVYPAPNCIQLALSASVIEEPGTVWRYNNKGFNLLAGIFQKLTEMPMDVYIKDRIFTPMGITEVKWDGDDNNTPYAFLGCYLRPRDLAKVGLLLLNKGKYNGKQILTASNLSKLYQPSEARDNYGLGWWISYYPEENPDEYTSIRKMRAVAASGSYGNYLIVMPEKNIVAVRLISYKTYGSSNDPYDLTEDQRGIHAFGNFPQMMYDMVK